MESVGSYIKRERDIRGITLEDISRSTKISIRFLKAIEADDYDSLPAETFLKGFLRSYAQSIGLDPQEAMLVYEQSKVSEAPGEKDYSKKTSTPAKEKSSKSINVKLVTAGVAVAVCLIVLIYFVFISGDEGEPRKKK